MSTYNQIKLTKTEQMFVDAFMDENTHPRHATNWEMTKKFLQRFQIDHVNQTVLQNAIATLCENILYKIYSAEADQAIESILDGSMTYMEACIKDFNIDKE